MVAGHDEQTVRKGILHFADEAEKSLIRIPIAAEFSLHHAALSDGFRRVSLSVQKMNYALRMYEKAGFRTVADRGEEEIMVYEALD